jgi:hypothetical protein
VWYWLAHRHVPYPWDGAAGTSNHLLPTGLTLHFIAPPSPQYNAQFESRPSSTVVVVTGADTDYTSFQGPPQNQMYQHPPANAYALRQPQSGSYGQAGPFGFGQQAPPPPGYGPQSHMYAGGYSAGGPPPGYAPVSALAPPPGYPPQYAPQGQSHPQLLSAASAHRYPPQQQQQQPLYAGAQPEPAYYPAQQQQQPTYAPPQAGATRDASEVQAPWGSGATASAPPQPPARETSVADDPM